MIILILVVEITVFTPYRIAFIDDTSESWMIMDSIIDFFFCVDVIVSFFSIEEDDEGYPIHDHKKLAIKYLHGWFIIDVSSSLPISLIA